MKRGKRAKPFSLKFFLYSTLSIVILFAIVVITFYVIYNNNLRKTSESLISAQKITEIVPNTELNFEQETEKASSELSKTIEEVKEEIFEENVIQEEPKAIVEEVVEEPTEVVIEEVVIPDPVFTLPVEGEIMKKFAKDELVYSETLQEWTTHFGVDIKVPRTTVVKSAEQGIVTAIKNDPRYGLTVIIEHVNGFKTVYANLLTTEFVNVDEKVEKGQSIGTVGNSAAFEILDEPHLHFEIIKDGEYLDPQLYLK